MQESSDFKIPLCLSARCLKYVIALFKEGKTSS